MNDVTRLILQLVVILVAARAAGLLFRSFGQPLVLGEMVAGILLGPSLFGWAAPAAFQYLFPDHSLPALNALSQIGLVLFMFLVGLTLEHDELHHVGRLAFVVSHVSVAVAFTLACLGATVLYPRFSNESVPFLNFALFLGVSTSIAAFPVMARILGERSLLTTRVGTIAIASAAVDDVTGWTILAQLVILIRATQGGTPWYWTVAGALLFAAVMLLVVRRLTPWFERDFLRHSRVTDNAMAAMLGCALLGSFITDSLGIHKLFGAFLMGAVMPKSPAFVHHVAGKFETLTVVLLLPLFFAYTGLRATLGVLRDPSVWPFVGLLLLIAVAGKAGGAFMAARAGGLGLRESATIGILMNTRGLTELVVLNIGLDLGVIPPALFSMMVLIPLATTFLTAASLGSVYRAPATVSKAA